MTTRKWQEMIIFIPISGHVLLIYSLTHIHFKSEIFLDLIVLQVSSQNIITINRTRIPVHLTTIIRRQVYFLQLQVSVYNRLRVYCDEWNNLYDTAVVPSRHLHHYLVNDSGHPLVSIIGWSKNAPWIDNRG